MGVSRAPAGAGGQEEAVCEAAEDEGGPVRLLEVAVLRRGVDVASECAAVSCLLSSATVHRLGNT